MIDRERMVEEVARVFDGDAEGLAFHGPATRSNLRGIAAEHAKSRPIADAHSIWELAAHLGVGRRWSLSALIGAKAKLEWWPPVGPQGPKEWEMMLRDLDELRESLLAAIRALPDDSDAKRQEGFRFLIHHELYHSGQIAILRRALGLPGIPG